MGIVEIRAEKAGQITGVDWFYAHEVNAEDEVGPRLGSALGGSGTASFFLPAGQQYIGAKPRGPGQTQWLPVEISAGETTPTTIHQGWDTALEYLVRSVRSSIRDQ